jgi:hypothetical protein
MLLRAVPPEKVPAKLRQAIRVFCTQRKGAIAVYVFHPRSPETNEVDELDLRIFVRLRDQPGHFYNDFRLMVSRAAPQSCRVSVGITQEDDEKGMAYIQSCTPVWPVMPGT